MTPISNPTPERDYGQRATAAALPTLRIIGREIPWSAVDGDILTVRDYAPFASIENGKLRAFSGLGPLAFLVVQSGQHGQAAVTVTHRVDFHHLWSATVTRGVGPDEELTVAWWSGERPGFLTALFASFLPRLNVAVFRRGAVEMIRNPGTSQLDALEFLAATRPLAEWRLSDPAESAPRMCAR